MAVAEPPDDGLLLPPPHALATITKAATPAPSCSVVRLIVLLVLLTFRDPPRL
jgi:hypothetical protein